MLIFFCIVVPILLLLQHIFNLKINSLRLSQLRKIAIIVILYTKQNSKDSRLGKTHVIRKL